MKTVTFMVGIAAGMALAAATLSAVYPDVSRRMARDTRRAFRCGKRAAAQICDMF